MSEWSKEGHSFMPVFSVYIFSNLVDNESVHWCRWWLDENQATIIRASTVWPYRWIYTLPWPPLNILMIMYLSCSKPVDTLHNDDVVIASKRCHFGLITSKWRRFDVIATLLLRRVFRGNKCNMQMCVCCASIYQQLQCSGISIWLRFNEFWNKIQKLSAVTFAPTEWVTSEPGPCKNAWSLTNVIDCMKFEILVTFLGPYNLLNQTTKMCSCENGLVCPYHNHIIATREILLQMINTSNRHSNDVQCYRNCDQGTALILHTDLHVHRNLISAFGED